MTDRESLVYKAKLAEQVERYDEMVEAMKQIVLLGNEPTVEERNLLSVAYKNVIGSRRSAWRVFAAVEQSAEKNGDTAKAASASQFRKVLEKELSQVSNEILSLIDNHLQPTASLPDSKVFYLKMKGDYYRYIAEYSQNEDRKIAAEKSDQSYKKASDIAAMELGATDPIRLGLALNYSVFHYEISNKPDEACKLARCAFDDAIAKLDNLSEESYKDSTLIMQLLRDNLTLWSADPGQDDEGEKGTEEKA